MGNSTIEEVERKLLSALSDKAENEKEIIALSKKYRRLIFGSNHESPKAEGNVCSFCGKAESDVNQLVAGPSVFICNECIELSHEIINEKQDTNNI